MKKGILAILTLLLLASCNSKGSSSETGTPSQYNFDFLIGDWKRSNEEIGKTTFEHWQKLNDSTYIGHSFTLKDKDTIWQENTVLSTISNIWNYQVKMQGDQESTNFVVIQNNEHSFTCENKENEFPKMIKYWEKDKDLFAEISSDEMKIQFYFEHIK